MVSIQFQREFSPSRFHNYNVSLILAENAHQMSPRALTVESLEKVLVHAESALAVRFSWLNIRTLFASTRASEGNSCAGTVSTRSVRFSLVFISHHNQNIWCVKGWKCVVSGKWRSSKGKKNKKKFRYFISIHQMLQEKSSQRENVNFFRWIF